MEKTIVGLFDEYEDAQTAVRELENSGFARGKVHIMMNDDQGDIESSGASDRTDEATDSGSGIGNFFRSLFGADERDSLSGSYREAIRRGGVLVSVHVESDKQFNRATEIMDRYNAVDIEERSEQWRATGWTGQDDAETRFWEDDETRRDERQLGGLEPSGSPPAYTGIERRRPGSSRDYTGVERRSSAA